MRISEKTFHSSLIIYQSSLYVCCSFFWNLFHFIFTSSGSIFQSLMNYSFIRPNISSCTAIILTTHDSWYYPTGFRIILSILCNKTTITIMGCWYFEWLSKFAYNWHVAVWCPTCNHGVDFHLLYILLFLCMC